MTCYIKTTVLLLFLLCVTKLIQSEHVKTTDKLAIKNKIEAVKSKANVTASTLKKLVKKPEKVDKTAGNSLKAKEEKKPSGIKTTEAKKPSGIKPTVHKKPSGVKTTQGKKLNVVKPTGAKKRSGIKTTTVKKPSGIKAKVVKKPSGVKTTEAKKPSAIKTTEKKKPSGKKPKKVKKRNVVKPKEAKKPSGIKTTEVKKPSGVKTTEVKTSSGIKMTEAKKPSGVKTTEVKKPSGIKRIEAKKPSGIKTTGAKKPSGIKAKVVKKPSGIKTTQGKKLRKDFSTSPLTLVLTEPSITTGAKKPSGIKAKKVKKRNVVKPMEAKKPSGIKTTEAKKPSGIKATEAKKPSGIKATEAKKPSGIKTTEAKKPSGIKATEAKKPSGIKTTEAKKPSGIKTTQGKKLRKAFSTSPLALVLTEPSITTGAKKPSGIKAKKVKKRNVVKPKEAKKPSGIKTTAAKKPSGIKAKVVKKPSGIKTTGAKKPSGVKTKVVNKLSWIKTTKAKKPSGIKAKKVKKRNVVKPKEAKKPSGIKTTEVKKPSGIKTTAAKKPSGIKAKVVKKPSGIKTTAAKKPSGKKPKKVKKRNVVKPKEAKKPSGIKTTWGTGLEIDPFFFQVPNVGVPNVLIEPSITTGAKKPSGIKTTQGKKLRKDFSTSPLALVLTEPSITTGAKKPSGIKAKKVKKRNVVKPKEAKKPSGIKTTEAKKPSGIKTTEVKKPSGIKATEAKKPSGIKTTQGKKLRKDPLLVPMPNVLIEPSITTGAKKPSGIKAKKVKKRNVVKPKEAKKPSGIKTTEAKKPSGIKTTEVKKPSWIKTTGAKKPSGIKTPRRIRRSNTKTNVIDKDYNVVVVGSDPNGLHLKPSTIPKKASVTSQSKEPHLRADAVPKKNVTNSNATKSNVTKPNVTNSNAIKSNVTKPNVTEPSVTKPNVTKSKGKQRAEVMHKDDKKKFLGTIWRWIKKAFQWLFVRDVGPDSKVASEFFNELMKLFKTYSKAFSIPDNAHDEIMKLLYKFESHQSKVEQSKKPVVKPEAKKKNSTQRAEEVPKPLISSKPALAKNSEGQGPSLEKVLQRYCELSAGSNNIIKTLKALVKEFGVGGKSGSGRRADDTDFKKFIEALWMIYKKAGSNTGKRAGYDVNFIKEVITKYCAGLKKSKPGLTSTSKRAQASESVRPRVRTKPNVIHLISEEEGMKRSEYDDAIGWRQGVFEPNKDQKVFKKQKRKSSPRIIKKSKTRRLKKPKNFRNRLLILYNGQENGTGARRRTGQFSKPKIIGYNRKSTLFEVKTGVERDTGSKDSNPRLRCNVRTKGSMSNADGRTASSKGHTYSEVPSNDTKTLLCSSETSEVHRPGKNVYIKQSVSGKSVVSYDNPDKYIGRSDSPSKENLEIGTSGFSRLNDTSSKNRSVSVVSTDSQNADSVSRSETKFVHGKGNQKGMESSANVEGSIDAVPNRNPFIMNSRQHSLGMIVENPHRNMGSPLPVEKNEKLQTYSKFERTEDFDINFRRLDSKRPDFHHRRRPPLKMIEAADELFY